MSRECDVQKNGSVGPGLKPGTLQLHGMYNNPLDISALQSSTISILLVRKQTGNKSGVRGIMAKEPRRAGSGDTLVTWCAPQPFSYQGAAAIVLIYLRKDTFGNCLF